jgi:hypothetical protein
VVGDDEGEVSDTVLKGSSERSADAPSPQPDARAAEVTSATAQGRTLAGEIRAESICPPHRLGRHAPSTRIGNSVDAT